MIFDLVSTSKNRLRGLVMQFIFICVYIFIFISLSAQAVSATRHGEMQAEQNTRATPPRTPRSVHVMRHDLFNLYIFCY